MEDSLYEHALWSDRFFNDDITASVSWNRKTQEVDIVELHKAAKEFKEANKDCPFDEEWLVKDFQRRL